MYQFDVIYFSLYELKLHQQPITYEIMIFFTVRLLIDM